MNKSRAQKGPGMSVWPTVAMRSQMTADCRRAHNLASPTKHMRPPCNTTGRVSGCFCYCMHSI